MKKNILLLVLVAVVATASFSLGRYQLRRSLYSSINDFAADVPITKGESNLRQLVNDFLTEVSVSAGADVGAATVQIKLAKDPTIGSIRTEIDSTTGQARLIVLGVSSSTQYYLHFKNDQIDVYSPTAVTSSDGVSVRFTRPTSVKDISCLVNTCTGDDSDAELTGGVYSISLISRQGSQWLVSPAVQLAID